MTLLAKSPSVGTVNLCVCPSRVCVKTYTDETQVCCPLCDVTTGNEVAVSLLRSGL